MSPSRIKPADVAADAAARILAALNGAGTADELARAVELADLPDVGLRLAGNLLASRGALGGTFRSLDEVAAVPEIGPVRFTRLVRALATAPPPPPRITPAEVSAADAFRILTVLNRARAAAELAAAIELEDEPDVGPRLGQRLLDRRAQLGGAFTTLAQVDETPEIGPVRFTRIVRALTAGPPPPPDGSLEDRVSDLQAAVQVLSQPPRIAVAEIDPGRYLGQPAVVSATVYGHDGRPSGDAVVTLSTSWGILAAADGYSKQRGSAVVVRTAADGTIRMRLEPPTSEDLRGSEQRAVELALGGLDPHAPTPEAVVPELREIAKAYRWEVNEDLRAGIDVYFRDFHAHLLDRVNFLDELFEWTYEDAFVTGNLLDADGRVAAAASALVRFKDWLGPWLQEHVALANEESTLSTELALSVNSAGVDDLLTRVQNKVGVRATAHAGVVGDVVARQVVDDALTQFLSTHVDQLADADRQRVFASLNTARETVATGGAPAFGAFVRARVDAGVEANAAVASGVAAATKDLAAKADVDAAVATLATKAEVQTQLDAKVGVAELNAKLAGVNTLADLRTGLIVPEILP